MISIFGPDCDEDEALEAAEAMDSENLIFSVAVTDQGCAAVWTEMPLDKAEQLAITIAAEIRLRRAN